MRGPQAGRCQGPTLAKTGLCPTLWNPVLWLSWMAAYPGCTLQMKTLFPGWPIIVHDTHMKRRRQVGRLDRALILLGLALCLPSTSVSWSSWRNIWHILLHFLLYLLVSWTWWDMPLTCLTNHCPSVLWHCWLVHLTHKIIILYHTIPF